MNFAQPLQTFIHDLSPQFAPPSHLVEWTDIFERVASGEVGVRALIEVPIRHFKTETTLHGMVRHLGLFPSFRWLLLTHSHQRAQAVGRRLRQLAKAAGVGATDKGADTIEDWSNKDGGGAIVMSGEQSRLGYDAHGLIFDDPIDERGSFDPRTRDAVDETIAHYTARCQRNGVPGPVMGVASPWHPDGPVGRRINRSAANWHHVRRPAILDEGLPTERAFAPDVWPLDALKKMRAELAEIDPTERVWWAQLMCDPRPDALGLFRPPVLYDELPTGPRRTVIGVDLAYSKTKGSDYFAMAILQIFLEKDERTGFVREVAYVIEIFRSKWDPATSEQQIRRAMLTYPGASVYSYMSGPEIGVAHYLADLGIPIEVMPARYSKRTRAQKTIDKSNDGRIRFPMHAPWLRAVLARLTLFSGLDDAGDDDEVDALVSAHDGGMTTMLSTPRSLGVSRSGVVVR